ncbi:hypothetical protein GCM10010124_34830 [Pilimelia terevasa]|uniref:TadE-like domain-containing protein n=1 Tax=Pilimelia terevasa TaxID=53372 RepID=A0A8J3FJD2_9ACTN|nr:TadE/TadG family type IV pilus assembly protein [Pilimelia terevasa]GGK39076.1 hypothetical protein GCM10010124_34830 [Pilimelia terevasa]
MRHLPRGHAAGADRGAAAVEMALVLPLLAAVLFGIIDFGRMFNAQISLTEAAREGARAVALGLDPDTRIAATLGAVPGTPEVTACAGDRDDDAVVALRQEFEAITPVDALLGGVTLTATGVMPCAG